MEKNSSGAHQATYISKSILPGAIIGGFIGIVLGFLLRTTVLIIPTLTGTIIGGLIGGLLVFRSTGNIYAEYVPETTTPIQSQSSKNVVFQIKEEQLDLAKELIQTGEVKIYRESFTKEKSFTVPVKREELVIEKKTLASAAPENKVMPTEVIRILLSEEQVEFTKHRVALEDVSIYKQQVEDVKHIEEILKKEELKVEISGSPTVRDESNQ